MKRLDQIELTAILQCPNCCSDLALLPHGMQCTSCQTVFDTFKGRPVLMSNTNVLFPADAYKDTDGHKENKPRRLSSLKRLIPKKSINLAREKMLGRIAREHDTTGKAILIVGCGNQTEQLKRHFPGETTTFVFCDIDKMADADIFCDSHELSFKNGVFDGVISTAVLEHVLVPDTVAEEMHRVLKDDAFIYSEIPFLQSVHEGAYDFTRFTLSGHRRLLNRFEEIDAGMVAGPGTALVWSIVDFFGALSKNKTASRLLSMSSQCLFFWLKYVDHLIKDNPKAVNAASCTYFYGRNSKRGTPADEIINKFEGSKLSHT